MNIKTLRRICEALPGTEIDIKWGADICFCVGKKMYAVTDAKGSAVTLKVESELFDLLTSARKGIVPAPYLARAKWVLVQEDAAIDERELASLISDSYRLVAAGLTKKAQAALGVPGAIGATPVKSSPQRATGARKKASKRRR